MSALLTLVLISRSTSPSPSFFFYSALTSFFLVHLSILLHSSSFFSSVRLGQLFQFSGGHIKSCITRAAARAAMETDESKRKITMTGLMKAAKEEEEKDGQTPKQQQGMYA